MKRFILHILLFFAIVAVVDFAAGKVFYYLQSRAGGRTGAEWHACKESNEDIIIMGSSRASHHYVPQIVSDSLEMSCYNAGQDGNGVILQYGRWKMMAKRHIPKVIIFDVVPSFDLLDNDNITYIDRLKPYSTDEDVKNYIAGLFPIERFKIVSKMYCYNYKFIEILQDCLKDNDGLDGFIPNNKHIRKEIVERESKDEKFNINSIDPVKIECLKKLIVEAKEQNVKVVLVSSPYWKGYPKVELPAISLIAEQLDVPFIDYAESDIKNNPDWFADSMHLNEEGAKEFTKDLMRKIRDLMGV